MPRPERRGIAGWRVRDTLSAVETLACGHVAYAGHSRVCPHLVRPAEDDDLDSVRLLTGQGS